MLAGGLATAFARTARGQNAINFGSYAPRQAATACGFNITATGGSVSKAMARSRHIAVVPIFGPSLVFTNFYCNGNTEIASGAPTTITAAIEYPSGTFTQILFDGSVSGIIPNGSYLQSGLCPVFIPAGAAFWVRSFHQNTAQVCYQPDTQDTANGEATNTATAADQTMGGTITNTNTTTTIRPAAIISSHSSLAIFLGGDSRCAGYHDTYSDNSSNVGELARSIGPTYPYINGGVNSERASQFNASTFSAQRRAIVRLAGCTHAVLQWGGADLITVSNETASQLESSMSQIQAKLGIPSWICTITPVSTSSDMWETSTNQAVVANEAQRVAYNTFCRGTLPGWCSGYFEIANQNETSQNSGLWDFNGMANYRTNDGIHESNVSYIAIQTSGAVNPAVF